MGRHSIKPWYWKQKKAWYTTYSGRRIFLAKTLKQAWEVFRKLHGSGEESPRGYTWATFELFLNGTEKQSAPRTFDWYKERIQYFKDGVPDMPVAELRPFHVTEWLDTKDWSDGHKRGVITALKRAFNWAVEQGHLTANPLYGLKKPESDTPENFLTPEQFKTLLSHIKDEHFQDLLKIVWYTGCRPQEASKVEARWLHDGYWKFPVKKSKGKKRPRMVFLTDEALAISKKWAERYPEGPMFRNTRGKPWNAGNFGNRFQRLKDKLDFKVYIYALRHSYCHIGLTKGKTDPVVMATLLGHKDTRQIMATYGHLLKDTDFMRDAARRASGS